MVKVKLPTDVKSDVAMTILEKLVGFLVIQEGKTSVQES